MITVSSLTFGHPGQHPIFLDFNWHVEKGESWSVVGPSGAGKTTLLYLLAGLKQSRSGIIRINDRVINAPRPETGLVLQEHGLLPWADVEKNIRLGFRIRRFYGPDGKHAPRDFQFSKAYETESTEYWMQRLGIFELKDRYPFMLSGGQKQRAAIARTLSLQPDLLLMDEPFASLDAPTRETFGHLLLDLEKETGHTRVLVTHNVEEAVTLGQKILVLGKNTHAPTMLANPGYGKSDHSDDGHFNLKCNEIKALLGESR